MVPSGGTGFHHRSARGAHDNVMVRWVAGVGIIGIWCLLISVAAAEVREEVLEITAQGFASTSIQLNVGDTIIWKNSDSVPHWPASNLHPSHALYSEFDPTQPIQPGDEWRFTFLRSGEWRFHDHLYPARGGVISVHGTSTDSASVLKTPSSASKLLARLHRVIPGWMLSMLSFETITAMVTEITAYDSPEMALQFIDTRVDKRSDATGAAVHGLKHIVGQALYERDGLEGLVPCTSNLGSAEVGACYHGVMEAFFVEQSIDRALDSSEFEHLCTPWLSPHDCLNIFHGIGHGYASFVGLDIEQALSLCTHLDTPARISACMTGVNMEWSESIPYSHIESLRTDSWRFCSGMNDARFQLTCAFEMPRLFSFLNEGRQNIDFDMFENGTAIKAGCMSAPYASFRQLCFQGAGFMAAIRSTPLHSVTDICQRLGEEVEDVRLCLIAGAQRLTYMDDPGYGDEDNEICQTLRDTYAWEACYEMPADTPAGELLGSRFR